MIGRPRSVSSMTRLKSRLDRLSAHAGGDDRRPWLCLETHDDLTFTTLTGDVYSADDLERLQVTNRLIIVNLVSGMLDESEVLGVRC